MTSLFPCQSPAPEPRSMPRGGGETFLTPKQLGRAEKSSSPQCDLATVMGDADRFRELGPCSFMEGRGAFGRRWVRVELNLGQNSTLVLLTLGASHFFVVGAGLCSRGHPATSLASTHRMPRPLPLTLQKSPDIARCCFAAAGGLPLRGLTESSERPQEATSR